MCPRSSKPELARLRDDNGYPELPRRSERDPLEPPLAEAGVRGSRQAQEVGTASEHVEELLPPVEKRTRLEPGPPPASRPFERKRAREDHPPIAPAAGNGGVKQVRTQVGGART